MKFGIKDKIETVRAIPDMVKQTYTIALIALFIAVSALSLALIGGMRNGN